VGLGNPGKKYTFTRHNLGYLVVDRMAEKLGISYVPGKGKWWEAKGDMDGTIILLMKPTTYMNNSGRAVINFVKLKDIKTDDLIVVLDDVDLPLGKIRIRERGSSGGHNGLGSILYQLDTEDIPRLRIGIGKEPEDIIDWVLSPFKEEEWKVIQKSIEISCNAIEIWLKQGIETAMEIFNKGGKV